LTFIPPYIRSITSNTGDEIELPATGVLCVVGGNNVGKSQFLRDVVNLLSSAVEPPKVVRSVELDKGNLSESTASDFLHRYGRLVTSSGESRYAPSLEESSSLTESQFQTFVTSRPNRLVNAWPFFGWFAEAGKRVQLGEMELSPDKRFDLLSHPLARLARDGDYEKELSDLSTETFGLPLLLDRVNGLFQLRVGSCEVETPRIDHPTKEYADAISDLPTLTTQGDGVKSFIGLALHILTGEQSMILIDEPEAFLHQSQARALGKWISNRSRVTGRQVILATHDRNIVLGLLDGQSDLSVVRLSRVGDASILHQLKSDRVREVWADPVLRYSNVLDGLFYPAVVICEADADCRFFAAVLDGLGERDARFKSQDVLFVPSGGKDRIPTMVESLTALNAKTFVIADFDVVDRKNLLSGLIASMQGDWDKVKDDWNTFIDHWNSCGDAAKTTIKSIGVGALPPGDVTQATRRLLDELAKMGILVVPCGAMEGMDRTIREKGTSWVNEMIETRKYLTCETANELISSVRLKQSQ
jgi:hypothetical protein